MKYVRIIVAIWFVIKLITVLSKKKEERTTGDIAFLIVVGFIALVLFLFYISL